MGLFLVLGSLSRKFWENGKTMSIIGSILSLTGYFLIYGMVHSWLASRSVKDWVRRIFGPVADRVYRLFYNIFATITLLPMLALMAILPNRTLYVVPSPWRWLMVGGQILAIIAAAVTLVQTGIFHFIGLRQLFAEQPKESTGSLNLSGFYAWVRHPLYTFSIVFMWLSPVMTINQFTSYFLFTLYFYIGSIFEERRLIKQFGVAYEQYRQRVPRLVPIPGRRYISSG